MLKNFVENMMIIGLMMIVMSIARMSLAEIPNCFKID